MVSSLSVVLPSGGPIATLYGLMVSFVGVLATAASLAEVSGPFSQNITYDLLPLVYTVAFVCEAADLSAQTQTCASAMGGF